MGLKPVPSTKASELALLSSKGEPHRPRGGVEGGLGDFAGRRAQAQYRLWSMTGICSCRNNPRNTSR